jgi:hypothetical protein
MIIKGAEKHTRRKELTSEPEGNNKGVEGYKKGEAGGP